MRIAPHGSLELIIRSILPRAPSSDFLLALVSCPAANTDRIGEHVCF